MILGAGDARSCVPKDELIRAKIEQAKAEARADAAEASLADIKESWKFIMAEPCSQDEKHCTCIPLLKTEFRALQAKLDAAMKVVEACRKHPSMGCRANPNCACDRCEALAALEDGA